MPSVAAAQGALERGTLTGTVRDASGGVLPGVTVEAASPALIEKVRTAVTDSAGVYRIVNLDPGAYTLTFTLEGFSQVKRENIELRGSATLTIPIEMRVGNLTETIIVSGESPVVDVQSTRREAVIDGDVISVLPGTRSTGSLITMIPGRGNLRCRTESVAGAGLLLRKGRAEQRRPLQRERHAGRQRVRGRRRVVLDLRHRERR